MTLGLENAANARDLGGLVTRDGRTVRTGRLFRAGALDKLSDADVAVLAGLGLACVVDFRDGNEAARAPDRLPSPAPVVVALPVLDDGRGADMFALIGGVVQGRAHPSALHAMRDDAPGGGAAGAMTELYRRFVNGAVQREAFGHALRLAASADRLPLLFHCTAGKDRTGWLSAVILTALDVERDAVLADYLRSNEASAHLHELVLSLLHGKVDDPMIVMPMVDARATYLEAAFAELLAHPAMAGVPVVVETPSDGHAGHAKDIATLRRLAPTAAPKAKRRRRAS